LAARRQGPGGAKLHVPTGSPSARGEFRSLGDLRRKALDLRAQKCARQRRSDEKIRFSSLSSYSFPCRLLPVCASASLW